jgi:ABC-2 type transport system permease protein
MTAILSAEWLRLRVTRSAWLLLVTAQMIIVIGVSGLMLRGDDLSNPVMQQRAVSHLGLVSLFTLVLGITAVAGEHRHRTISDTYLAVPRRARVVVAKLVVYTAAGLIFGLCAAVSALGSTAAWLALRGETVHVDSADLWRTVAGGIAWNAVFAALGVGIGALIANQIGAIAAALAWLALIEGLVGQLIGDAQKWLPFALGSALDLLPTASDGPPQWVAALALTGYAATFTIAAVLTTTRRDVT